VTDAPEYWVQAHGYERPYVAQIKGRVTNPLGSARVGNEDLMQGDDMETVRVLTLDEYVREVFGEPGWVEEHFDERPLKYGERPKKMPKGYVGRSVDQMTRERAPPNRPICGGTACWPAEHL
jgi:hypothetical protein